MLKDPILIGWRVARGRAVVRRLSRICVSALAGAWLCSRPARADFQGATHMMPFEEEAIGYAQTPASGPIARLAERLKQGQAQLEYDPVFGYLPAVLKHLSVSEDSQLLVFSKTSMQREHISPRNPRALFFNDSVYVGFIPGAPLLELSEVDPKLGAVFYTLEQKAVDRPRFVRTDQCLECHASSKSMGVPGHLVRSFVTRDNGVVDLATGISPITHRTPLADRWGGWCVTGTLGSQAHRGNLIGAAAFARQEAEPNFLGNVVDLSPFVDLDHHRTGHSDVAALMVFEHQTHMHNFITRLNYAATLALRQYGHVKYLKSASEAFLKYMLFTEEVPLTAPLQGTSGFASRFSKLGPKDRKGRSLYELELQTRMFKHPCSYLIYSEAFEKLPQPLLEHLYRRLWDVLTGTDQALCKMAPETRQAILEILADTKPDLPDYWRNSAPQISQPDRLTRDFN
jgi:hypothetical protein